MREQSHFTHLFFEQSLGPSKNVVALQAELSNAKEELDRQKAHNFKKIDDLKIALRWAEKAKRVSKKSLAKTRSRMTDQENALAATKTSLHDATVDEANLRRELQLTQDANKKQLAKMEAQAKELGERLEDKTVRLNTNQVKFKGDLQAKQTELGSIETKLEEAKAKDDELEEQIEDRQSELKDQQKKAALIKLKLDIDHGKLQKEQSKSSVLTAQVALLKKGLAAKNDENSKLQSSIESLTKAVAAERKSAKKAQAQAKAFQLIGIGLNRTLGNVDEERTRALLISSDLLKVHFFFCRASHALRTAHE